MTEKTDHRDENLPALGRALTWVDRPGSATRLVIALALAAVLVAGLGFFTDMHGVFGFDNLPVFYAAYGFIMFTGLILAAKGLRVLVKRPEDYYAPDAVDAEAYPEDQLERIDYDA